MRSNRRNRPMTNHGVAAKLPYASEQKLSSGDIIRSMVALEDFRAPPYLR